MEIIPGSLPEDGKGNFFLVDPWEHFDVGYRDTSNVSQARQDSFYRKVVDRFRDNSLVHVIRKRSIDAALGFDDGSLDWVFIDANHSYESVKQDVEAWWPKVRSGGLFSGHDYFDGLADNSEFGVKSAVDEFLQSKCSRLPQDARGSWMIIKP